LIEYISPWEGAGLWWLMPLPKIFHGKEPSLKSDRY
jgi:hypothetical protein